jgi:2-polyprenyl-3-methyl-5-hydroxy-6-metoxy-1,4-benzoquinol methylase
MKEVQKQEWEKESEWESHWWGNCINTFGEEQKHFDYAPKMGIKFYWDAQGPHIDAKGLKILDVGGGPVSMLLKCVNLGKGAIVDPCDYPEWTTKRYESAGITFHKVQAEEMDLSGFDEAWSYNLLQHVQNPEKIVKNMLNAAKIIRVFDWLHIAGPGHPHYLTEKDMNEWYEGEGKVEQISGGLCYSGVFKGHSYAI